MRNVLLNLNGLPPFSAITPDQVSPALQAVLDENRKAVQQIAEDSAPTSWKNLVEILDDGQNRLNKMWSPVSHMNSVVNTEALRDVYNQSLPILSNYFTELGQNEALFKRYQVLSESTEYAQLNKAQQKIIYNALRDFRLSGIDLPTHSKQRFKDIKQQLSSLTSKFSDNVLDATQGWNKHISNEQTLSGLPASAMASAQQAAQQKQLDGYLFSLEFPSYYAVMTYADDAQLRREMHDAYVTRASDQGDNAGKWDNMQNMQDILALRHELAQLLEFENYAEYSLATKMAPDTHSVIQFLEDLAQRSKPMAQQELQDLSAFAQQNYQVTSLNPWDIAYYSEKYRQHLYAFSQEQIKPYFPEDQVVKGLFDIVNKLYGISISAKSDVDTWHKDVHFFEIKDQNNQLRGQFYLDLYARANKRGGAWMDECICRRQHNGKLQIPVAYLTCNFSAPVGDDPALLTHQEVTTLFHEFGHGLHHMLTQVDALGVSGINGVPWDAVELPSQFLENWCWERKALDLFARHYKTGESLPDDLFNKMQLAKNFQSGMQMLRQLEFALFDFKLHLDYQPPVDKATDSQIQATIDTVREQFAVIKPASYNRFQNSFSHIFSGGYAAGYYSYKWAEVLSADAFSKFEENGIFDRNTGEEFLHAILEQGGSQDPMELFEMFRGRQPSIDALLRHSGLISQTEPN